MLTRIEELTDWVTDPEVTTPFPIRCLAFLILAPLFVVADAISIICGEKPE